MHEIFQKMSLRFIQFFLTTPLNKDDMEKLTNSCVKAAEYPKNLVYPNVYGYNLRAYYDRLDGVENELFWSESDAFVDFWESHGEQNGEHIIQLCFLNTNTP